jgi:predicted nucleotidyltransferase
MLLEILDLLENEDEALQADIRTRLAQGKSHVRARSEAAAARLGIGAEVLSQPNTALALEYMRVNRTLKKPMQVHIVHRTGGYHDETLSPFASASAIRSAVKRNELVPLAAAMPSKSFELLQAALQNGHFTDMSRLDALLIDRLRTASADALASLCDVSEGLENRISKCAEMAGSREALLAALKCKRYTHARLSRLCAHALLGLTKEITERNPLPRYARVLGFKKDARALLTHLRDAELPLVTRASVLRDTEEYNDLFTVERRATDLQSLCFGDESMRKAGRDLTEKMIIL